jgi:hypothetical protein
MQVSVYRDGVGVGEGRTPMRLELPMGTYSVVATSSKYHEFDHWTDNSRSNATTIVLLQDAKLTAHYRSTIESRLGTLGCSNDHKTSVAESMLRDGSLGGMLELHMRRTTSAAC